VCFALISSRACAHMREGYLKYCNFNFIIDIYFKGFGVQGERATPLAAIKRRSARSS
jgi:hypothetical protein